MTKGFFNAVLQPIKNDTGNVVSIMSHVIDVTEQVLARKKLEESVLQNAMLAAIIQSSQDAIISKTLEGIITSWNAGAEKIFGYKAAEMIGEPITKIIPLERIKEEPQILSKISQGHVIEHFETMRLHKEGKLLDISLTVSPIKDSRGNIIGASKIARDISQQKEIERKINESEKELQQLIIQAPVAIVLLQGEELRVKVANESSLVLMGKKYEEVINQPLSLIFPELHERVQVYQDVYKTGIPYDTSEVEITFNKNGMMYTGYYDLNYSPWRDGLGKIKGVMSVGADVTSKVFAKRALEQSEKELDELANAVPQLVWMADGSGKILYYNKRINEFTSRAKNSESVWLWEKLLHPEDLFSTIQAWNSALINKTPYEKEHRLELKDGSYRWFLSRGYPQLDKNGHAIKWYGTATDIHQQKIHEAQKDDFLKMVSHELKTPITSVKGYVQLLLAMMENHKNEVTAFLRQPLLRIDYQVDRLGKLITELLDISRLEDGKMDMDKDYFLLDELVKETVLDILFASSTHKIVITQTIECMVYADKSRIGQALINLINNAIKYSPESNLVEISIYSPRQGYVSVAIQDFGIGIEESEHKKIFQRFYQAGTHKTQNYAGFGIGLYLTSEIIKRNGGTINLSSAKNEGALFTFILPCSNQPINT